MGMRGTDETRARPWLEVLPVAVEGRLRIPAATVMSTGACRHERAVHTPDPRAQAVLHCEGRVGVRSSVRDDDVHVEKLSLVENLE